MKKGNVITMLEQVIKDLKSMEQEEVLLMIDNGSQQLSIKNGEYNIYMDKVAPWSQDQVITDDNGRVDLEASKIWLLRIKQA